MLSSRRVSPALLLILASALPLLAEMANAQPGCGPGWADGFSLRGLSGTVHALTVFDDGSGPALYVAGSFATAGNVTANSIAKWNGSQWSPLGDGVSAPYHSEVYALAVFNDGTGPALYAAGYFTSAGGVAANSIAKWNGTTWSPLGSGITGAGIDYTWVRTLAVFDDGTGPALYAGGLFTRAGGLAVRSIAKWNGSSWSGVGSGIDDVDWYRYVLALEVFNDGSGPALYAGGLFNRAGGITANNIAKWNGSNWSPLGSGTDGSVNSLASFDDGSGPALYASGSFYTAGGVPTGSWSLARWNGTAWASAIGGLLARTYALKVADDGNGPRLYAIGSSPQTGTGGVIKWWNGSGWSELSSGFGGVVLALTAFDDGSGAALYAGGTFCTTGDTVAARIAKRSSGSWLPLGSGSGISGTDSQTSIHALTVFDDGISAALYAGGRFETAGGVRAGNVARWDGSNWSRLGNSDLHGTALALTVFDDGSGNALYAAGRISTGGAGTGQIVKWTGSDWLLLGSGVGSPPLPPPDTPIPEIYALIGFDDGCGSALVAGGSFSTADGETATNIAKWDGSNWSPLGPGLSGSVSSLVVFDDGTGPALYAGGSFSAAGGLATNHIAKWDGTAWSAMGTGIDGAVSAMAVFDDGSGPRLYAGGRSVVRWDRGTWTPLGEWTYGSVKALVGFDDGSGSALYAGSGLVSGPAAYIAKWSGSRWSPLDSGLRGTRYPEVSALTVFSDGSGSALYAGGDFTTVGGLPSAYLAKWKGGRCLGDLDCDESVGQADLAILLAEFDTQSGASYEQGDLDGDGDVDLADLAVLLSRYNIACP